MNKPLGIYLHLPFCLQKCPYCDFCSFPGREKEEITNYAKKAAVQLEEWSEKCKDHTVDTIYFGGGTPTLLSAGDFGILMSALHDNFNIAKNAEITAECNPATSSGDHLAKMRDLGINRLSIGAQSLDNDELKSLGRLHTAEDFIKTFKGARGAGFTNISADLIYGTPGQSAGSFGQTLTKLCDSGPEHISAYCLKVEESTPYGKMGNSLTLPDEDETADMYFDAIKIMSARGLAQYEISNFARAGYESKHNLKYWNCDEYLGIGLAAHSYFGGERFACHRDLGRYLEGDFIDEGSRAVLSEADRETEYVMLALRLSRGLDAAEYIRRFGRHPAQKYGNRLEKFERGGYVISDEAGWRLTPRGMFVSNHILSSVLEL